MKKRAKKTARRRKTRTGLDQFKPDPQNARLHGDRNRETIAASLTEYGAGRSILVDADNIVRAGNGTIEEAKRLGLKPRIVNTDGRELVVVRRTDLRGERAQALALADNRTAELAGWNHGQLDAICDALKADGLNLESIGFSADELAEIAGQVDRSGHVEEAAPDQTGQLTEKFYVLVSCESEGDQAEFLNAMGTAGRECRALNS